ncbi:MAG: hypothetical protein SFX72_14825 [Isosphaeraceae bacterium]|nr:hypothetical protein [Isosphaeraceae bacterium]
MTRETKHFHIWFAFLLVSILGTAAVADDGPVVSPEPRNDTTTLGRSMIIDRVAPSAIPFPDQEKAASKAALLRDSSGGETSEALAPIPISGVRRRSRSLFTDPAMLAVPLGIVALLGGIGWFASRRSKQQETILIR